LYIGSPHNKKNEFNESRNMDINLVLGLIIMVLAFGFMVYLMLYSRKNIDTIAEKKLTNVRQIMREMRHDRSN